MALLLRRAKTFTIVIFFVIGLIIPISVIPLQIAFTFSQVPQPQAILVLGGDAKRVIFATKIAQKFPQLNVWISDLRYLQQYNHNLLRLAGIARDRVYSDICATDTVTNFTCTVEQLTKHKLRHLYLVTSDYHMRRARAIATFVFGSRGIVVTPLPVPSQQHQSESWLKIIRDCIRSVIWIVTGKTGASFNPDLT